MFPCYDSSFGKQNWTLGGFFTCRHFLAFFRTHIAEVAEIWTSFLLPSSSFLFLLFCYTFLRDAKFSAEVSHREDEDDEDDEGEEEEEDEEDLMISRVVLPQKYEDGLNGPWLLHLLLLFLCFLLFCILLRSWRWHKRSLRTDVVGFSFRDKYDLMIPQIGLGFVMDGYQIFSVAWIQIHGDSWCIPTVAW